jgi:hypothetical protein
MRSAAARSLMLAGPSRLEAAEDRELRDGRPGLGAQPAQDPAEGLAQLVRELRRRCLSALHARHSSLLQANCTGSLYITPECRRSTPDRYKWVALSNATLAVLLATLDASITIIAMPDIFRGIHLDPLVPANSFYLLWMILGYLVVTSVLIVSLGRLGDMVGRVKIYNLGFVIYTVASLLLAIDWMQGPRRSDVPDRLPRRAGHRRRLPAGQRGGDHHRRLPRAPARHGAGDQQHRRRQRHVHRPGPRRHPRPDRLAPGLPHLGARRAVRHGLGLRRPARAEHPRARRVDWAGT